MDASTPQTPDLQRQQERKRKRKALLAGGVVLGLGAAVTLAAWSDDVFADGLFNTGGFELQASTTGAADSFKNYDGPGGSLDSASLEMDSTTMSPGDTVYAPLTIKASDDSNHDGEFTLDVIQSSGKYSGIINYTIYSGGASHGANCSEAGVGSLDQWATGFTPIDPTLDPLTDGVLSGTLRGLLDLVTGGVTGVLGLVGIDLTKLVPTTNLGLPYIDPTHTALPVSPGTTVQHLCIAANLGGEPVTLPIDLLGLGDRVPQAVVQLADTANPSTDDTRVTWIFTGQATN